MYTPLENTIKEAVNRLVNKFNPEKIILFGSQARGTADEKSDIDFLVICSFSGNRYSLLVDMDRALKGLIFARDIVVLTPEEYETNSKIIGTIARPASIEGKILYERGRVNP